MMMIAANAKSSSFLLVVVFFVLNIKAAIVPVQAQEAQQDGTCEVERLNVLQCYSTNLTFDGQEEKCVNCLFENVYNKSLSCTGFGEAFCEYVITCGCDTCADELEAHARCSLLNVTNGSCGLDCNAIRSSSSPPPAAAPGQNQTGNPVPTSAPISTNSSLPASCNEESAAFVQCAQTSLTTEDRSDCLACVTDRLSSVQDSVITCLEAENILCDSVATCGCGTCSDELGAFGGCVATNATQGSCTIDCSQHNTAPTPVPQLAPSSQPDSPNASPTLPPTTNTETTAPSALSTPSPNSMRSGSHDKKMMFHSFVQVTIIMHGVLMALSVVIAL